MDNSMHTNLAISGLLQAAKVTLVEIRGLCCHGNGPYMAKNCRISCQDPQNTNGILKVAGNEAPMGSMSTFLQQ